MNKAVSVNFSKIKLSVLTTPLVLIVLIVLVLYLNSVTSVESYVSFQKEYFIKINAELSKFPILQKNLTECGDTLVVFCLFSVFLFKTPKLWEGLLLGSLISGVFSNILKAVFSVPRPAAMYDNNEFVIIGESLVGHNSLPSGHSITVFVGISILIFSFMPFKRIQKVLWCAFLLIIGIVLIFTRVGVGAHYPLDVIFGGLIGFISGVLGIYLSNKTNVLHRLIQYRSHPITLLLLIVCTVILGFKIYKDNLLIYFISLSFILYTIFLFSKSYVRK